MIRSIRPLHRLSASAAGTERAPQNNSVPVRIKILRLRRHVLWSGEAKGVENMPGDLDRRLKIGRKTCILGVRLAPREYALLRLEARKIGRKPSEIVRMLLREWLKKRRGEKC